MESMILANIRANFENMSKEDQEKFTARQKELTQLRGQERVLSAVTKKGEDTSVVTGVKRPSRVLGDGPLRLAVPVSPPKED